jgi:hypothetical protein
VTSFISNASGVLADIMTGLPIASGSLTETQDTEFCLCVCPNFEQIIIYLSTLTFREIVKSVGSNGS